MNSKPKILLSTICFSLLIVALGFWQVDAALAHERVEVGPYVIIVGWENEPVIVGERNALVLDITRDDEPVRGVEATLDVTILYAGRVFNGNLNPSTTPGHYTAEIYPTVRGQYVLELTGMIEETEIDESVEPEEVLPAAILQFPDAPPDPNDLQNSIDTLTSDLEAARTMAIIGIVVGVLGIGVGAASFVLNRQR